MGGGDQGGFWDSQESGDRAATWGMRGAMLQLRRGGLYPKDFGQTGVKGVQRDPVLPCGPLC